MTPLPELLRQHHHDVERACAELRRDTYGDDRLALIDAWRRFEMRMSSHMLAEEELMLAAYAKTAPDDAKAIRAEHERLRAALVPLAIEVELHLIRAETIERLLALLRAHASHEDAGLYPWAEGAFDEGTKRAIAARLAIPEAA